MKKLLILSLTTVICASACSKKSTPKPTLDVIEYDFVAAKPGTFVVLYSDPANNGGSASNVYTTSWSQQVTIPAGTMTAKITVTGAQEPPYTNNNSGTVTIKLNGKVVASGSGQFTNSQALAEADYNYTANN